MPPTDPPPNYADLIAEARRLDGQPFDRSRYPPALSMLEWAESAAAILPALADALETVLRARNTAEGARLRAEDEATALRAQRDSVQRTNETLARDLRAYVGALTWGSGMSRTWKALARRLWSREGWHASEDVQAAETARDEERLRHEAARQLLARIVTAEDAEDLPELGAAIEAARLAR